jgi:hypothetical protein
MFNPCSNHPSLSRMTFAATGVRTRAKSAAAGIVTFCAGRQLYDVAVFTNDPGGGPVR